MEAPTAATWWSLFDTYLALALITASIVFTLLVYNILKYREKNQVNRDKKDNGKYGPVIVAALTAIVLFGLAYSTFGAITFVSVPPSSGNTLEVRLTAFQWGWNFTYPNGKSTINTLYVPANTTIVVNVTSRDVFHSFGIPSLKVKVDAIPGKYNVLWFEVPTQGNYEIRCYELCGVGHAFMNGTVVVMSQQSFMQWYGG